MKRSLFEFDSYISFLEESLLAQKEKGARSRLAKFLNCQPSFLSQVLSGRSHFSLEHALRACDFFQLTRKEKDFFMLLVQKEKAGTADLQNYFQKQMDKMISERDEIKEAVGLDQKFTSTDYGEYYSSWWYAAIHIACAIPNLISSKEISQYLNLPFELVDNTVDFLLERGLVRLDKNGHLQIGKNRIHVGSDSPLVHSHHRNWRTKAMDDLSNYTSDDIRFTGVLCLSLEDGKKIRNMILNLIKESEPIIRDTDDEEMFTLLLDFYRLSK